MSTKSITNYRGVAAVSLQPSGQTAPAYFMFYIYMMSKLPSQPVFHQPKTKIIGIFFYIRYNKVRIHLRRWHPTSFCVANRLQHVSCLNSYGFQSIHADTVSMYRNLQQCLFEREDPYQKIESKPQNCKDIAFLRENTRKRSCVVELYHTT